jgi:hypothetical protein
MSTATDVAIEDFVRAHAACVDALRVAVDPDWTSLAGSLVWSASHTAAHLTDVLYSYAFQAAAHGTRGILPFEELHAGPGADAEGLVDGIHASGVMLASVLRCMPDTATSQWWGRGVAAAEWAAMGTRETLLHTYDIAIGLGVELVPPPDVASRAYEQWHSRQRFVSDEADDQGPDVSSPDDSWAALVRASERPFGDDEWETWRRDANERRGRPAPPESEAGVIGDFADGSLAARFGPGWRAFSDERLGGKSTGAIEVSDAGPPGLAHALRVDGSIEESDAALNMAGATFLAADDGVANLSAWQGVRFWARGAERPFAVWSLNADGWGGRHVVPLCEDWTPHRLPFAWFGTDGSELRGLLFAVDSVRGEFWFELGDVRLY